MRRSLYRRRNWRSGKLEKRWTIAYQLADGRVATERAFTDKAASEQLLAQREREVARREVGMADPHDAAKGRPVLEHLADYLASRRAAGVQADTITRTDSRLRAAFAGMQSRTLGDVTVDAAARYVDGLVLARNLSLTTRNHLVASLRAFGAWLAEREILPANPLKGLSVERVTDADRTEVRRVLTAGELRRLVEAAPAGRRRLYLFAAYTGFRRGEDKATTWSDLNIDGELPTVRIRGANAKSGASVEIPIPPWLALELRQHRAERSMRAGGALSPTDPVFDVPAGIVRQLRQDAARAGLGTIKKEIHTTPTGNRWVSVEWVDPTGPEVTLVLHSLRAFYATTLFEQGTPAHEVQRLCRHQSIATTLRHYTAWRASRLRSAVDALPNPLVAVPVAVDPVPTEAVPVPSWPTSRSAQGGQSLAE